MTDKYVIQRRTTMGLETDAELPGLSMMMEAVEQLRGTYSGKDLTVDFADEIAGYSDVWAWIKARITTANYNGIVIGDYIPFTMNGNNMEAQIAGIDCYYRTTDQNIGHHIDFISKLCYPTSVQWNTTNNNNGTSSETSPWLVSNIYSVLNTTWYNYLPTALKNQIVNKRFLVETRYSSSGSLTSSNGWKWANIGNLWLPTEYEVFGSSIWSTKGYGCGQSMQYPLFANSYTNRLKGTTSSNRVHWWLLSVSGIASTNACLVDSNGDATTIHTSTSTIYAPVCFRIG